MQWKKLQSDNTIGSLAEAIRRLDCSTALRLTLNLMGGSRIYIDPACFATVMAHVGSDMKEVGGILLGRVWENQAVDAPLAGPLVFLVDAVPAAAGRNSSVSVEMGAEIWGRVNERVSDTILVVGWYHSHPQLGAYFSATDRGTQRAFFNNSYSVGWVIDPVGHDNKVYVGREAEEYRQVLLVTDHALVTDEGNIPSGVSHLSGKRDR
jgi:proteasome lid subunit RPN8/RPN11